MQKREFFVANQHRYDQRSPLRWIISHILRYPFLFILMIVSNIVTALLYSLVPVLLGQAFNIVSVPGNQAGQLLVAALFILLVRMSEGVFDFVRSLLAELLGQRLERDARQELYINLLGKSQSFYDRLQLGDITARVTNDTKALWEMINPGVTLIIESLLFTLLPLIMIALLNIQLLLIPIIYLFVCIFLLKRYSNAMGNITRQLRTQFGIMNATLVEAISGIEVVKALARELQEYVSFSKSAQVYRDKYSQEGRIQGAYTPLLLYGLAVGLAVGHSLLLFRSGSLTIGGVISYIGLMLILRTPATLSLFTFGTVGLGLASARRILSVISAETDLDENLSGVNQPMEGSITFVNVSFSYDTTAVLNHLNFQAQAGETVAIVGHTGAGKTSLTKLVNRTYDTTAGQVLVDGKDVGEWNLEALRSQIGTIEQDVFLFSRTVRENIAFGVPIDTVTMEQIEQAARAAQAHDFILQLPQGYETQIGERGVTLSGGQRQRIAIARAFLTNPRILILDDSTSAIDSATEDNIQRAMRHILRGRTTLLITHRISQIRWADRILVLQRGQIVAQGTHDELLQNSEDYRKIFARYTQTKTTSVQTS